MQTGTMLTRRRCDADWWVLLTGTNYRNTGIVANDNGTVEAAPDYSSNSNSSCRSVCKSCAADADDPVSETLARFSLLFRQLHTANFHLTAEENANVPRNCLCYRASSYAGAVLAVVILSVRLSAYPSVRPSICPSHACFVAKTNNALRIFWYHTKWQAL